jgi:hypothetical protein
MLEPGVLLQQNDASIRQSRRQRNGKVKNEISKMWNCRFAAETSSILHFAL